MLAWVVEDSLHAPSGIPLPAAIALIVWIVVFTLLKRLLEEARPES